MPYYNEDPDRHISLDSDEIDHRRAFLDGDLKRCVADMLAAFRKLHNSSPSGSRLTEAQEIDLEGVLWESVCEALGNDIAEARRDLSEAGADDSLWKPRWHESKRRETAAGAA